MSKNYYKYLAIIPARKGSKRIFNKNLKILVGKPLIYYTIQAALKSKKISKIIVSTDSKKIAKYTSSLGIEIPFLRPKKLATDKSPVINTILHVLKKLKNKGITVNNIVLLQPTSPFRTNKHIDESIRLYEEKKADTLISVKDLKEHPYWAWGINKNQHLKPFFPKKYMSMERYKLSKAFIENGAIFITKRSNLKLNSIYGKRIIPYIMDEDASIDIDTVNDWLYAEYLLKRR